MCLKYLRANIYNNLVQYMYSEDNASRCKYASTPLYKDWLVASLISQVGSTCALIMFSVSFLISG